MTAFGFRPLLLRGRDRLLQAFGIDIEAFGMHIDKDRRRADKRRGFRGRAEREGRAEHRVARADLLRHQHQHQRVGAARAGQRILGAAEGRELGARIRRPPAPSGTGNGRARAPTASSIAEPSLRRCAATSMNGIGVVSSVACWFIALTEKNRKKTVSRRRGGDRTLRHDIRRAGGLRGNAWRCRDFRRPLRR